jgi:hypothetical protein
MKTWWTYFSDWRSEYLGLETLVIQWPEVPINFAKVCMATVSLLAPSSMVRVLLVKPRVGAKLL